MCDHWACFTTALRAVSDLDAMAASAKRAPSRISTELSTSGPIRLTRISVICKNRGFRLLNPRAQARQDGSAPQNLPRFVAAFRHLRQVVRQFGNRELGTDPTRHRL
eukprot:m.286896 g.286896  ORF g.286896 m.286896 type:complete len:107 (+) comp16218_c0_seq10:1010-1330(+)